MGTGPSASPTLPTNRNTPRSNRLASSSPARISMRIAVGNVYQTLTRWLSRIWYHRVGVELRLVDDDDGRTMGQRGKDAVERTVDRHAAGEQSAKVALRFVDRSLEAMFRPRPSSGPRRS
jgi:hypothetical protein